MFQPGYFVKSALTCLVIGTLLAGPPCLGAKAMRPITTAGSNNEQTLVRTSVQLVNIYATVKDCRGTFVRGLSSAEFLLTDNGKPQMIEFFSEEDQPLSLGILLDTSASMKERMPASIQAINHLLSLLKTDDDYFLLTFNTTLNLMQDFTSSPAEITNALYEVVPNGLTALNDAIYTGVEKVKQGRHKKRAIILISDGQDTASWYSTKELLSLLNAHNVLLYSISISSPQENTNVVAQQGLQVLKTLSSTTGGQSFVLNDIEELGGVLNTVRAELHHQYTIGFYPEEGLDGRWHLLKLRLRKNSSIIIYCRRGYRAISRW